MLMFVCCVWFSSYIDIVLVSRLIIVMISMSLLVILILFGFMRWLMFLIVI